MCLVRAHRPFARTDRQTDRIPPSFVRRNKRTLLESRARGMLFAPGLRELALTKIAFKSRLIQRKVASLRDATASSLPTRSMFYHVRGPPCGPVNWKNGTTGRSFRVEMFFVATEFLSPDIFVLFPFRRCVLHIDLSIVEYHRSV